MNDDLKRWDEEAEVWDRELKSEKRIGKLILDAGFVEALGPVEGKKVLDAGCGNGRTAQMLKEQGAQVVGIDGSPKMIELAKTNCPGIEFRVSDLLSKLDFRDSDFDVIVCQNVLMSLQEVDTFLSEAFRLLKSGGVLAVSALHPAFNEPTMRLYRPWWYKLLGLPVAGLAKNYFQKTRERLDDYGTKPWPFYHRTVEQYVDAFRKHGFIIDRITEPHDVPEVALKKDSLHYASRLPRFILFRLVKQ